MKEIILLFIAILGFATSKTFSLLLIYASPDKVPHILEASICFLTGAIFISSFFHNIKSDITVAWKWVYSVIGIIILAESLPIVYALFNDERITMFVDNLSVSIFIFANLTILVSLFFTFKKVTNEK